MCAADAMRTMASMNVTKPFLATFAALLLVPAAAQAGTVSYEGDTLVYRADPGVRDSPGLGKDDAGKLTISEEGMTLPGECTYDYVAHCPMPARVRLELGDGDDWNSFTSDYPASLPAEVYGGDGKDQINGDASPDDLNGGNGDDFIDGGPHLDSIRGDSGIDTCVSGEERMSSCER